MPQIDLPVADLPVAAPTAIDEAALKRAAARLRRLAMPGFPRPASFASVLVGGLGAFYHPSCSEDILRAALRFYAQEAAKRTATAPAAEQH